MPPSRVPLRSQGISGPIAQCQRIAAIIHLLCVPLLLIWWRRYDRDAETLAMIVPLKASQLPTAVESAAAPRK